MREINLIAIVLEMVPLIEKPFPAANWYGKAAQSLLYECMLEYGHSYAQELHALGEEKIPFTTSTLMGKFKRGCLLPGMRYYLRFTGLNQTLEEILYISIQPGGFFSVGSVLELVQVPFSIENIYWENHDHDLSCYSSYRILEDYFLNDHCRAPKNLRVSFEHFPIIMQNGDHFNPLITPPMLFSSLLRKWNNHAERKLPAELLDFVEQQVYVSTFRMESQPVQQEGLVIGGRGFLQVETKRSQQAEWRALNLLAAYGFYSGVGKYTTRGFGMMRVD